MIKNRRHKVIREIVDNNNIETQFQLTDELRQHGFNITQATVSRDIKEMGLVKIPFGESSFRYSFPMGMMTGNLFDRTKRMFKDNMLKIDNSENIIVIQTLPGMAQGVASCVDCLAWKEILGTVAGDDTVIIIIKNKNDADSLIENFHSLAQ